jgi:N-acyl-D-aspartate/D-glutamate deacylase
VVARLVLARQHRAPARGYKATLVNGHINILDDELTGARAGMVLRAGVKELTPA